MDVDDMVFADLHHVGAKVNHILVVVFAFAECVVAVDVFDVRVRGALGRVALCVVGVGHRVAFGVVVVFVAVVDFYVVLVVVGAAEKTEVVA